MLDFLWENVFRPIFQQEGYNPYNTAFYALAVIALVELYWKYFVRGLDGREFRRAALPFMVLAGAFRFLNNRLFPQNFFTVTPGIFLLFIVLFTVLYIAVGPRRTEQAGWALAGLALLAGTPYLRFGRAAYAIPPLLITPAVAYLYRRLPFMGDLFAWVPHIFEAWITSFGVMAGLIEEHVLAGALMSYNPLLFGLIKTALLPLIMYLIKDAEEGERLFVGTVIGALGIGPGLRDLLELLSLGG